MQAPEADVLNLASVPEEQEGEGEGDVEELEETIEALMQQKRMLAERNASLQNKVHQARLYPMSSSTSAEQCSLMYPAQGLLHTFGPFLSHRVSATLLQTGHHFTDLHSCC